MTNAAPAAARAAAAAAHAAADAVVAAPAAATALPTAMGVAKDMAVRPGVSMRNSFLVRTSLWTLVTDLSTGTDRTLVTEMRRLSILTGAGRVLVMGAYTGPDGSVERRTSSYAKTHETPKG